MLPQKKEHPKEKAGLHPRNRHRTRYDFRKLTAACPALHPFVQVNAFKDESIDFFNPAAVKMLNKALLKHYYGIDYWDIPPHYLCPPIPGRADYIHHLADLLAAQPAGAKEPKIPRGARVKCLDIGVGANCVYPIIGSREYGWSFVGADIDPVALASANHIIERNEGLKELVEVRLQTNPHQVFRGIIQPGERFELTLCNPPFHASAAEAQAGSLRKLRNLKGQRNVKPVLNFGGQHNELWCEGGEVTFIGNMVRQSKEFGASCFWFTTLVSKSATLKSMYQALQATEAVTVKTIDMSQGNKASRLVAWTFLSPQQQQEWAQSWSRG